MKKTGLFLLFVLIGCTASAQVSRFAFGYNVGIYTQAQNNLQAHAQVFNTTSDELIKPIKVGGFYRGVVLGWKWVDESFMMGLRWSTKK